MMVKEKDGALSGSFTHLNLQPKGSGDRVEQQLCSFPRINEVLSNSLRLMAIVI